MRNTLVVLLLLIICFRLEAQKKDITLTGIVVYQNSNKKPAIGVEVKALGATHKYTNVKGYFCLQYADKEYGDPADLDIGAKDKYNKQIELVNAEVIRNTNIPREQKDTLYIVVCPAGQLSESKSFYYDICLANKKAEYESKIKHKQEQLNEAIRNNLQYQNIQHELDSLQIRLKMALNEAASLAAYIAQINEDFASDMIKEAILLLKEGKAKSSAINAIDEERIRKEYLAEMEKKKQANIRIQILIDALEFKVKLYLSEFQYQAAALLLEKIKNMYEENKILDHNYRLSLIEYSMVCKHLEDYTKTLELQQKILQSIDLSTTKSMVEITTYISALSLMGSTHNYLQHHDSALYYLNTAYACNELLRNTGKPPLDSMYQTIKFSIYDGLSRVYRKLPEPDSAVAYTLKKIALAEKELGFSGSSLGQVYSMGAMTYTLIARYDSAFILLTKAIDLLQTDAAGNQKDLADAYKNLAICQLFLPQHRHHATESIRKAYLIHQAIVPAPDFILAEDYFWAGMLFNKADMADSSKHYYLKSSNMYRALGSLRFKNSLQAYWSISGNQYYDAKKYDSAILFLDSAFQLGHDPEDLNLMAISYDKLGNHAKAIACYQEVLSIDSGKKIVYLQSNLGLAYLANNQFEKAAAAFRIFESQHIDTARVYRNLAAYYSVKQQKEPALQNLELAIKAGYDNLEWLTTENYLAYIRKEPRFLQLIEQLKARLSR